jgi:hypothetical protein
MGHKLDAKAPGSACRVVVYPRVTSGLKEEGGLRKLGELKLDLFSGTRPENPFRKNVRRKTAPKKRPLFA